MEVALKHKLGLLLIITGIAVTLVACLFGIKDAAVYIIDKIVAIATVPSPPKITNVYVQNSPSTTPKSKNHPRKRDEDIESQPTPAVTNVRPVQQPAQVAWKQPQTNNLGSNRFEILLPVHLQQFDSRIWASANQNVTVKYDANSSRGRLRYEVTGQRLPLGETKEGDKNNNWSDSIKIFNEEPIQDAYAKPYVLLITLEEAKPKYTHNDCVKLVYEKGGNLNSIPSDCMAEWERYQADEKRRQEREIADAQRQEERRRQDAERERIRKQQDRDRILQNGVSTIERIIRRR